MAQEGKIKNLLHKYAGGFLLALYVPSFILIRSTTTLSPTQSISTSYQAIVEEIIGNSHTQDEISIRNFSIPTLGTRRYDYRVRTQQLSLAISQSGA